MGLFEESYQQLNSAQRQAVDTIDGPVLVVAGPGTGKTQLLSMRVANILRQTDTDAGNILCLTFTNKAALNMRERIIALTGNEAKGVMVKTFHSFAAELMNTYPDHFWKGARLSTAPDAAQTEIIQSILRSLPLDNPLAVTFAGNFTAGKDVKNALKYVKEAGLTPNQLRAIITANLAYINTIEPQLVDILNKPLSAKKLPDLQLAVKDLPRQGISTALEPLQDLGATIQDSLTFAILQDEGTGKTKHTGKWKQRWVQSVDGQKGMHKERERNTWWLHLADVYEQYRTELHARGYYDFADMIVEVITQLQQSSTMRADVQERFLYILIDEFQDTNAAQLQLAHLIAGQQDNASPNLMVVGDDDQSIYKFNGAELNNMLSFQHSYPNTKVIVLTDNYRSSQEILQASTKIIEQVSDRLVTRVPNLRKILQAKNEPVTKGQLRHQTYPTADHQLSHLARQIADEFNNEHQSIAVLARGHDSLRRMASMLTSLNIAVNYEQQNNILEHPLVQLIYEVGSALQAIRRGDNSTLNVLLTKIVRAPAWNISPEQLWHLATDKQYSSWLDRMINSSDNRLRSLGQWFLWLANETSDMPLLTSLEYILGLRAGEQFTSPLRSYYLQDRRTDTEYLQTLSAIRILYNMAREFSASKNPTLNEFTTFLQVSLENGDIIADETAFVTGDRAVHLLTVHKAKGLEFDTVHIIDAVDSNWRPSSGGRKCPVNIPLQPAGDDADDYARLMFVAATRARQNLYAHSYQQDEFGKEVMATPLLSDILTLHEISTAVDSVTVLEESLHWPHLNSADEKRNLQNVLDNFALSATALLDFLDVSQGGPEYFFEKHLLRLPSAQTANMAFGTAMHAALEYAQLATNTGALTIEKVTSRYSEVLQEQQLPEHEFARYLSHGQDLLRSLLESETFWLGKGDVPEQNLTDISIGSARLKGALDRIHQSKEQTIIIDYKTGKPLSSFTTRDQTKAIKAWRHRMQLSFYVLLVQESKRFAAKEIVGQMWYLEASLAKELVRAYTPSHEELTRLQNLIQAVWPKIQDLNLPDIRHYSPDYSGIQAFEQDLLNGKV